MVSACTPITDTFPVYREQCTGFKSEKLKIKITDTLDD